jgi:lysozyme
MLPSQDAIDIAKAFEGLRLEAYPDPGTGGAPWTIGYGHTGGVRPGDKITAAQAETFLIADLANAAGIVAAAVIVPVTQGMFDACTDFVFNVGPGKKGVKSGFVELKEGGPSTLLRLINQRCFGEATGQFKFWANAGGKPMSGLVRRRAAEAALFNKRDGATP